MDVLALVSGPCIPALAYVAFYTGWNNIVRGWLYAVGELLSTGRVPCITATILCLILGN